MARARNVGSWQSKVYGGRRLTPTQKKYKTRLNRKLKGGGSFTKAEWNELLNKFNHTCPSCHRSDVKLCADHIIPVFLGGSSNIGNIQPLCSSCNSSKRTKIIAYNPFIDSQPDCHDKMAV